MRTKNILQVLPEPDSCPKFHKCNAPICPLDAEWHKRVLLGADPTCFYLTESVKEGAETVFEEAGLEALYRLMMLANLPIISRHARLQKALNRAKLNGFRMTNRLPSRGAI